MDNNISIEIDTTIETKREPEPEIKMEEVSVKIDREYKKVSSIIPSIQMNTEMNYQMIDTLLEKEKTKNKLGAWNKFDKTHKMKLLYQYAEEYGLAQQYNQLEITSLKMFFLNSINNSKFQKAKDVNYDKENQKIISIPALHFNRSTQHFTLKMIDSKRVSTLKSLAPLKRSSLKNNEEK